MKKQLFSTLSLLFCSICVAFAQQDPKTPEQLFIQKHTLPNGVWVPNTQFSIEKRETANIDWIEYVNMIGNVAEMVQEDGIAKGGSWTHTLAESTISAQQLYTKPTNWLGFRCIAEFKLTPKNATK